MNPFPPDSLVAFYLRDSGGNEQELSIDQQRRVLTEWTQINGLRIGREFSDSISGTSTKGRDEFLRMMAYFQHDPPEAGVLVWRSNRWGRNLDDAQYFKSDLRRRGYIVHSITDNIPEGPMGKLIEFALDWKDEIFSAQLSEDVKRGLTDLVQIHGGMPGTPPRGFIRVPVVTGAHRGGQPRVIHRWEPDPEQIPVIQRAYEMRARGATLRQIQEETGLYKNKNSWVTFFENPLYKGTLRFGDLTIENYCAPVVTPELWNAANLTGQQRRHVPEKRGDARRVSSIYMLSGLLRCKKCGALMSGKRINAWHYYACSRRMSTAECDARHIPAPAIETHVLEQLTSYLLSIENLMTIQSQLAAQYTAAQEDLHIRRAEAARRLTAVTRQMDNLTNDIAQNGPSDSVGKALRRLETEAAELRLRLENLSVQLTPPPALASATMSDIAHEITDILQTGTLETKRYYLKSFIQSISVLRTQDAIEGGILYTAPF
jgi:DNA invertase Pin-like site-specific DNA recombinase